MDDAYRDDEDDAHRDDGDGTHRDDEDGPLTGAERAMLERARRGFLATADAHGRPAAVPVCFALPGSHVVTPVDEKPKDAAPRDLRRIRDLRANPSVALVVDRWAEDWGRLAWVQLRGTARVVEPGEDGHADAVDALRTKYDQYADHALDDRPVVRIEPGHVVSWGAVEEQAGDRRGADSGTTGQ